MKMFCENIWHSLTQEKEEKNHKPWDRISFSFHVAMWVKEPSLSLSKSVCVGGVGGGWWWYAISLSSFKGGIKMHMHSGKKCSWHGWAGCIFLKGTGDVQLL